VMAVLQMSRVQLLLPGLLGYVACEGRGSNGRSLAAQG